MKKNDAFTLKESIKARICGNQNVVALPPGTVVTVVLVYGDEMSPEAYGVEAFLPDSDSYALATIDSVAV